MIVDDVVDTCMMKTEDGEWAVRGEREGIVTVSGASKLWRTSLTSCISL